MFYLTLFELPTDWSAPDDLYLAGVQIPALEDGDMRVFLAKPVGAFLPHDIFEIEKLIICACIILVKQTGIDDVIRLLVKKTLNLPMNAANEYIFGNKKDGLVRVPLAAEDSDIACVDRAFKLLTSRDPILKELAWEDVCDTADFRYENPCFENVERFLNSVPGYVRAIATIPSGRVPERPLKDLV